MMHMAGDAALEPAKVLSAFVHETFTFVPETLGRAAMGVRGLQPLVLANIP